MENTEIVVLPPTVEVLVSRICSEKSQPPLSRSTKQALAQLGEESSLKILQKIQVSDIKTTFDKFLMFLIRKESNFSPQKRSNPSPVNSPAKTTRLMMNSPVTPTRSFSENAGRGEGPSSQLVALGELEFRKAFLILSYIGENRLEEVIPADEIRSYKNLAMDEFEKEVWDFLGRHYAPADRVKSLEWDSGKTYEYHCHVNVNGSYRFKGPYFEKTRSHLQRVLGDDNVLAVKFEDRKSSVNSGFDEFKKVAKEGILVGLRRYRFFVFKDGGKTAKKKDQSTSPVRCLFVRFESNASVDRGKEYVLSGKTVKEARSVFMHVHTLPSMAKYMARFSLILSKSMKLEVDIVNINFMEIEDICCKDKDGSYVPDKDGKHRIHTDGTGYISEDLALKCPRNVFKGSIAGGANVEIVPIVALMGETPDMKSTEFNRRIPPLLLQIRFFYNGYAVKGTVLVNKKLPPRTIQVRDSMIKVRPDSNPLNICTRNSFEVVTTSNQPKRTSLSRNLIMLLSYGGVPDDFFMELLKNALEESQGAFSNKRAALRVALNRGGMDELGVAKMILSGIPLDESYLQYRMSIMLNEERKGLLGGKLPITDTYYLMGTVDPSGVLETNEVSIILDNGQISGKVLVYRQPGVHFGDIHVLNSRYVKELDEYVGHAKYAIFFPCKGPRSLADEMAGGDFDGDLFFVSKNPQLLDYFKASEPWVEKCSTPEGPSLRPNDLSDEELESELFDSFLRIRFHPSYAMSAAADNWLAIMDRLLTVQDSSEKELMKKNLECLINLYYEALDASKSGKKVEVQEELRAAVFPHYMERDHSFKSTSILGKMYDYVKSFREEVSKKLEVRKLACFDNGVREECREKWTVLYEKYRKDMCGALNCPSEEQNNAAADAVFDKYKKELYGGALELAKSQKPMEEIRDEAIAIYNICYDYAIKMNDVGKCKFAWKVAGSVLLNLNASKLDENLLSCAPSVLRELFS
ncbi:hypothetical protein GQ457_18G001060 [Hibiscus cannabinus]